MKSRRILLESSSSAKASPAPSAGAGAGAGERNVTVRPPARGISPPGAVVLQENRTAAAASSPPSSDDDSYDLNARFNPSMAIIIVVLLSAFFFMGFFSIYIRRCTSEEETERASRRGRGAGNGNARGDRTSQGLDREVIESFPIFSYSLVKGLKKGKESLECAVCLSEFEEDESLRMLPKCSHTFHPDCIDMWLQSHTTCPVCRTSLVPGDGSRRDQAIGSGSEDAETGSANGSQVGAIVQGSISLNGDCSSRRSHDSPILGLINSVGGLTRHKIRRSNSTGHSLVRSTCGASNLKAEQSVNLGQSSGIHRSSSCVSFSPNSREPSNCAGPSNRVPGSGSTRPLDDENSNVDPRIIRSERWSFSMNPPFFLRTYSERTTPYLPDQLAAGGSQLPKTVQQDGNAYMQSLRRSIKWLTGRDPGAGSSRSTKTEMPNP